MDCFPIVEPRTSSSDSDASLDLEPFRLQKAYHFIACNYGIGMQQVTGLYTLNATLV